MLKPPVREVREVEARREGRSPPRPLAPLPAARARPSDGAGHALMIFDRIARWRRARRGEAVLCSRPMTTIEENEILRCATCEHHRADPIRLRLAQIYLALLQGKPPSVPPLHAMTISCCKREAHGDNTVTFVMGFDQR